MYHGPAVAFNSKATVDELVSSGKYAEAASLAEEAGDFARASTLFERIWDFRSAARCAEAAGDVPRALQDAIDSRDSQLVTRLYQRLQTQGEIGMRSALEVFERKRRFDRAGECAEALGDHERAIEHYLSSHRDLDAARLLEQVGRDREAGQLYERVLEHGDPGERPTANLRLGLLLARRLQHQQAVRYLQSAARTLPDPRPARRALIVELAAMGLREAAREALLEAREHDTSLPLSLDELLRSESGSAARSPLDDLIAGRYRLEELIGAGATGRVYRAVDEVSGQDVAIKIVTGGHARGSPPYERFTREAGIAATLRHGNLVEVYDFSADFGYLVMELMAGGSLEGRGKLSHAAVRRLALDILGAIEAAHRRGVIHRDIKPGNIFLDARGTAKLGDFGVAHLLDLGQTQTGGLIGTLAYMSPEQITGAPLTVAADFYSLGVTLFESVTGRLPFLGPDYVAQHLGEEPPLASEQGEDIAPGWDPILARLLRKDPAERYASSEDIRKDIEALRSDTAPRALMIPRSQPQRQRRVTGAGQPAPASPDEPRYRFESPLGTTPISTLSRAVDAALDRSVIIERYEEDGLDAATERRLLVLAKGAGPFLQRVLSYDRTARVAIYEAPAGQPIGEEARSPAITELAAIRLLKGLARAVWPLHGFGAAHGAIGPSTVVLDEEGEPTLLASGLGPAPPDARFADDVLALASLTGRLVGETEQPWAFIDRLIASMSPPVGEMQRPHSGEELFELAEQIELGLLRARFRNQPAGR